MSEQPPIEARMAQYYAQRAAIYERVYHKPERQCELRAIEAWLPAAFEGRRVLEVACGTGWWTPYGARAAAAWLATDFNPETMDIARAKPMPQDLHGAPRVRFAQADAYSLQELSTQEFDAAFAGCWLSHVPLQRLSEWASTLHARLACGARVVLLDNSFTQTSSTPISRTDAHGNTYQERRLDDGSTHEVLKNFLSPEQLRAALGPRVAAFDWWGLTHYWVASYELA